MKPDRRGPTRPRPRAPAWLQIIGLAISLAACGGGGDEPAPRYEARPLAVGERLAWRSERVLGNGTLLVSTLVQQVNNVVSTPDGPRATLIETDGTSDWQHASYVDSTLSADGGQLHAAQAIVYLPDIDDHDLDFSERYAPALVYKPFPLYVGSHWSAQWAADGDRPAAVLEGSVEAEETILVAGASRRTLRVRTTLVHPRPVDFHLVLVPPVREDRVCWWDIQTQRDVECRMHYAYAPSTDLSALQLSVTLSRQP